MFTNNGIDFHLEPVKTVKYVITMDYITGFLPSSEEINNDKNIDEKVLNYRKQHKRCKYCKYLKLEVPCIDTVPAYYKCVAKDKIIRDMLPDMTNVLRFCSCYTVNKNL